MQSSFSEKYIIPSPKFNELISKLNNKQKNTTTPISISNRIPYNNKSFIKTLQNENNISPSKSNSFLIRKNHSNLRYRTPSPTNKTQNLMKDISEIKINLLQIMKNKIPSKAIIEKINTPKFKKTYLSEKKNDENRNLTPNSRNFHLNNRNLTPNPIVNSENEEKFKRRFTPIHFKTEKNIDEIKIKLNFTKSEKQISYLEKKSNNIKIEEYKTNKNTTPIKKYEKFFRENLVSKTASNKKNVIIKKNIVNNFQKLINENQNNILNILAIKNNTNLKKNENIQKIEKFSSNKKHLIKDEGEKQIKSENIINNELSIINESKTLDLDEKECENLINWEKYLYEIQKDIQSYRKIMNSCKNYLGFIANFTFLNIENLKPSQFQKDVLKTMIILERSAVLILLVISFNNETSKEDHVNSINLLKFIHQNILIFISIKKKNLNENHYEKLDNIINCNYIENTQNLDNYYLIEHNNLNLSKLILYWYYIKSYINKYLSCEKNDKEPYLTIKNIIQTINNITLEDSSRILMECFSLLINSLQADLRNDLIVESEKNKKISFFLPEISPKYEYTLVLDLDETLVHFQELPNDQWQFLVRPFAEEFIKEMSKYYEIVIFTAATKDYADWILDLIDENKYLSYRLYRDHTSSNGSFFLKDLSKLGRNIEKIIIVDNLAENFQLQPDNGIFIQSWFGDPYDTALFDLSLLLKEIVIKKASDVRKALRVFRDQLIENIKNGIEEPHKNLHLQ